ncbi:hypothetical protein [Pontibacterium sp.]|uniref:hypothetical protein n=1 Tax=Pontibacterium sp. TaxID=2036026 RepID=UPI003567B608
MAQELRYLNISEIARMFQLSRDTVRARLVRAKLKPVRHERNAGLYDMSRVGPALFRAGD